MADMKYREKTTFGVKVNEFSFVDLLNLKSLKNPFRAAGIGNWIYRSLL